MWVSRKVVITRVQRRIVHSNTDSCTIQVVKCNWTWLKSPNSKHHTTENSLLQSKQVETMSLRHQTVNILISTCSLLRTPASSTMKRHKVKGTINRARQNSIQKMTTHWTLRIDSHNSQSPSLKINWKEGSQRHSDSMQQKSLWIIKPIRKRAPFVQFKRPPLELSRRVFVSENQAMAVLHLGNTHSIRWVLEGRTLKMKSMNQKAKLQPGSTSTRIRSLATSFTARLATTT